MHVHITRTGDSNVYMQTKNLLESAGHTVTSLPLLDSRSITEQIRMRLQATLQSDTLVVLPTWQKDSAAYQEVQLASSAGIPVMMMQESGTLVPRLQVIGISGYARSGKDTIGARLISQGYVRASFADYIRQALYALNPCVSDGKTIVEIIDSLGWEGSKPVYPEIREQLQRLGSEVGRSLLGENIWVDLTFMSAPDGQKIVVTDCRFPNEAEAVKRLGGEMWRVERPGFGAANGHISEIALDTWDFDAVFKNDSTVDKLHQLVNERMGWN